MRVQKLTLATLVVAAGLSLTACQNDDLDSPTAASTPTATTAPTKAAPGGNSAPAPASPAGGGKATTGGTGSTDAGKGGKCRTDDLTITAADHTIDGDAQRTVVVELKNHSGHDCSISGYAGVDLKTNAGSMSAQRSGEPVVPGVLKNGKSTFFGISYPANNTGGTGLRLTGLVVTPPDETKSVTLQWPGAGSLPATDTPGNPVKVGPIGSAGQGGQ
ncbi:DUF4232 domain-containing protein [Streptomyces sp. NRRL S-350]|uniref:DUF4232 domain-containing protein n=1 Tax=Streptomyces sp. NRRL S-350 TaxID=1463902 RepID=UPI0004C0F2CC|nr:DUF4232 domain-containing protein [Streptomyces sp. NRRL S-350]